MIKKIESTYVEVYRKYNNINNFCIYIYVTYVSGSVSLTLFILKFFPLCFNKSTLFLFPVK